MVVYVWYVAGPCMARNVQMIAGHVCSHECVLKGPKGP